MKIEYERLWDEESNPGKAIYKVTEFYDWHNCNPDIDTTIFMDKNLALDYMCKRMEKIPQEMFDVYNVAYSDEEADAYKAKHESFVHYCQNPNGSICLHNYNDYWTISMEQDEIVTSINNW